MFKQFQRVMNSSNRNVEILSYSLIFKILGKPSPNNPPPQIVGVARSPQGLSRHDLKIESFAHAHGIFHGFSNGDKIGSIVLYIAPNY